MERLLKIAKLLNAFRVIPRLLMLFYMSMTYQSVMWFTNPDNFPESGPTSEQAILISVIVGAGAAWFAAYTNSGNH